MKNFTYTVGALLFASAIVQANCGLENCPRLSSRERAANNSASLQVSNVAFALDSGSGYYQELLARYEFTGLHDWVVGGSLPLIALTTHDETHLGISNPLLYVSWYDHLGTGMIYLGTQLELPFGMADEGMATDHLMLVPYVLIEKSFGPGYLLGNLGYSHAFTLHKHKGGEKHPLFVSPHEDQEILYRFGTGFRIWKDKIATQFSLSGSHALRDELEVSGRDHSTGKLIVVFHPSQTVALSPFAELPLSLPKRLDWMVGLEVKSLF